MTRRYCLKFGSKQLELEQRGEFRARGSAAISEEEQVLSTGGASAARSWWPMNTSWWTELQIELERARRFQRDFVLIRVSRPRRSLTEGRRRWHRKPLTEGSHLDRLQSLVRSIDKVWADGVSTYILLPETSRAHGLSAVERLREDAPELFTDADVAVVAFPGDALTAGALLDRLEEQDRVVPRTVPADRDATDPDLAADLSMPLRRSQNLSPGRK